MGGRLRGSLLLATLAAAAAQAQTDSAAGGGATPPSGGSSSEACARFNAEFTEFHQDALAELGGRVREQDGEAARLRSSIESLERLKRTLIGQALGARDLRLRRHLREQARVVDGDLAAARARLKEIEAANREAEERYKSLYEERARAMLAGRPPGCPVEALD